MRKVVDSNFLQSEDLRAYLSTSTHNYAVITEFTAMEAYKENTLISICRRMEVLSEFSTQVIVLKPTIAVCGLSGGRASSQKHLIDESQTREFPEFCQRLQAAKGGNLFFRRQILEHGCAARANMHRMLLDSPLLCSGIESVARTYTPGELKVLRRGEKLTPQMRVKLIENVLLLTWTLAKKHPSVTKQPRIPQIRNTFLFRYALCAYILVLKRIADGGVPSHAKLRNDMIDVNFAAFATYFDGLLTLDRRAAAVHAEAEVILETIFCMPPPWSWANRWPSIFRRRSPGAPTGS